MSWTGRQFEQQLVELHQIYKKMGSASIGRYGVQCAFRDGEMFAMQSLPDFEGLASGFPSQIIFDAKVVSGASMPLSKYRAIPGAKPGSKRRQLSHMYDRADFGACCFFLIHFNERELKKKSEPPQTFVFPVVKDHPFWVQFESLETSAINRDLCESHGHEVFWKTIGRGRKPRPDWLSVTKRNLEVVS